MVRSRLRTVAIGVLSTAVVATTTATVAVAQDQTLPREWTEQIDWRSVGPATMGGRITDIAVYEANPSIYWLASASGGLLKTTNNGVTFTHQFDDEATVSIGDIAVAQADSNIIWVGTGEANPRNSVSWGNGVYKSTDGGETFEHMGLEDSFQIGAISIHPENPDIVYVGALGRLWGQNEQRGLFKTTDGGETWEKIHYVDDKTGVIDIRMKPDDPDTLVIATYERQRDLFDSNDPAKKWGPGSGIWRTTDGGETFTRVSEGLPSCDIGRIGLDWYRGDPNVLYAIVESSRIGEIDENAAYLGASGQNADVGARITGVPDDGPAAEAGIREGDILIRINDETIQSYDDMQKAIRKHAAGETVQVEVSRNRESMTMDVTFAKQPGQREDQGGRGQGGNRPYGASLGGQRENVQDLQGPEGHEYGGLYRSEDAGQTWTRINSINPRPMYYSEIRVDPSDNNHIWVLGTSLYRSEDGGKTFASNAAGRGVHVDHHSMWINPNHGEHVLLGNDGGHYVTYDRGSEWVHHNTFVVSQFYHVGVDHTRDYMLYGGLQDNGSWGGPNMVRNDAGPENEDWFRVGGGDGFICLVDPEDPDLVYSESQGGAMGRTNFRTGDRASIRPRAPRGQRYRFNWRTPFLLSNHNPRIFYAAGNHVFKSLHKGDNIFEISPEITNTDRGSASALAESPRDAELLFVGTDDGALWKTEDGGDNWTKLLGQLVVDESDTSDTDDAEASSNGSSNGNGAPQDASDSNAADDSISGTWNGEVTAEQAAGQGGFTLTLKLGEEGAVTGSFDSEMGGGAISNGKFDAENNKLTFDYDNDQFSLDFEALVSGNSMTGTMGIPSMDFMMPFEATRGGGGNSASETQSESAAEEATTDPVPLPELVKKPMLISGIEPSRFAADRVYLSIDGHRSDDLLPHVFVSEDRGSTWRSIRGNLPDGAGSVRTIREDIESPNVLYIGTEFGAYVSIDRGQSWTSLNSDLPTVAVHEIAQHPLSGEIVAGTHGRGIWIADITPIRQMSSEVVAKRAHLYEPNTGIYWDSKPSRGGTMNKFVGENPDDAADIFYSLASAANSISLKVYDVNGNEVADLAADGSPGLHVARWNMRGPDRIFRRGTREFRRPGPRLEPGHYRVVLTVGNETQSQILEITGDPASPHTILWGEEYDERLAIEEEMMAGDEDEQSDGE